MSMPGRQYVASSYRYGMNGQEHDDEIASGIYTAEYWEYDSRIGRRWNIDPVIKSWESPYATFNNNPIYFSDPSGLEGEKPNEPGHVYDCGDGTKEVFNGQEYVPSAFFLNEVVVKPKGVWDKVRGYLKAFGVL